MSPEAISALESYSVEKLSTLASVHGQPGQAIKADEFTTFHKAVNNGVEMNVADVASLKPRIVVEFWLHSLAAQHQRSFSA